MIKNNSSSRTRSHRPKLLKTVLLAFLVPFGWSASAQNTVEWTTLGSDFAHTRSTKADQITPENFSNLEVAWVWDGASFEAQSGRSTPSYINGRLYTVAGARRHVVAIDPKSGATIWSYREPDTPRWDYSMRADYGKGIGYANIDGRDVIYIISPGFFLTALDAETGKPLQGFGEKVSIEGFPETGVVDLLNLMCSPDPGSMASRHGKMMLGSTREIFPPGLRFPPILS